MHEQLVKRHNYKLGDTVTWLSLQEAGAARGTSQEATAAPDGRDDTVPGCLALRLAAPRCSTKRTGASVHNRRPSREWRPSEKALSTSYKNREENLSCYWRRSRLRSRSAGSCGHLWRLPDRAESIRNHQHPDVVGGGDAPLPEATRNLGLGYPVKPGGSPDRAGQRQGTVAARYVFKLCTYPQTTTLTISWNKSMSSQ